MASGEVVIPTEVIVGYGHTDTSVYVPEGTANSSRSGDWENYMAWANISMWTAPICAIFGLFGNLLTFLVMCRERNRRISCCVYMAVLSVSDSLSLSIYTGFAAYAFYDPHVIYPSKVGCKLGMCLVSVSNTCGTLLLVALTVDRYLAVCHPLKSRVYCSPRRAKCVSCIVIMISILYNIPNGFFADLFENKKVGKVCLSLITGDLYAKIFGGINIAVVVLIPFIVLLVLNLKIIKVIRGRRHPVHSNGKKESPDTKTPESSARKMRPKAFSFRVHSGGARSGSSGNIIGEATKKKDSDKQLTIMLLFVTFAYLILTAPQYIRLNISLFYIHDIDAAHPVLTAIFVRLYALNFAINFYLYYICGSKFRQDVCRVLFCVVRERSPDATDSQFANVHLQALYNDQRNLSRQVSQASGINVMHLVGSYQNLRLLYARQLSHEAGAPPPSTMRKIKMSFEDYRRRKTSMSPPIYINHAQSTSNIHMTRLDGGQRGGLGIESHNIQTTLQVPGIGSRSRSLTHLNYSCESEPTSCYGTGEREFELKQAEVMLVDETAEETTERLIHRVSKMVVRVVETEEEITTFDGCPQISVQFCQGGSLDTDTEEANLQRSNSFSLRTIRVASTRVIDVGHFFKDRHQTHEDPYLKDVDPFSEDAGDDSKRSDVTLGRLPRDDAFGLAPKPPTDNPWRMSVGALFDLHQPTDIIPDFHNEMRRAVSEHNLTK